MGWVESGWRQYSQTGVPLISDDFGYGIMQITSGMAGASHDLRGSIDGDTQSKIASNYAYNIAIGASILAQKYAAAPKIGNGDPQVLEHWYYALWAYNGWGWGNNPNNSRFDHSGSPASHPAGFPYQERVLYLVAHPPRDSNGLSLWRPTPVSMPSRHAIGVKAGPLAELKRLHLQPPPSLASDAEAVPLQIFTPGGSRMVKLKVVNSGLEGWPSGSSNRIGVGYHIFTSRGNPWADISPFSKDLVQYGQGVVHLARNVLPGQSIRASVPVHAPTAPGTFLVIWDMVQGDTTWFSAQGAPAGTQVLQVVKPGALARATPMPGEKTVVQPDVSLRYLKDTSFPDGTTVAPRAHFDKGWLVFNDGKRTWSPDWLLQLRSGPSLGAKQISLPTAAGCTSANIVVHLHAPSRPRHVVSVWQLRDPAGTYVGERLSLRIDVRVSSPQPTVSATPHARPTTTAAVPTPTPVG
ncbi:MAG: hypothetical protein NVSMB22_05520 [Chloroflexota bacterium]